MNATDETNITEIELLPDGRICVFGTSLEVLELLDELQGGCDELVQRRMIASGGAGRVLFRQVVNEGESEDG